MTGVTDLLQQVRPEDVDDPRDHWVMDEVQINRAANLARVDKSRVLALRVHHRARTKTYDVQTGRDLPCTLDHYKSKVTVMTNGMMICEECQRGQHLQHRWSGITLLLQKKAAKKVQDLVANPTEEEDAIMLMQTDMQPQAVTQPEAAPNIEERKNEEIKEERPEAWLSCSCLTAFSLCAVRMIPLMRRQNRVEEPEQEPREAGEAADGERPADEDDDDEADDGRPAPQSRDDAAAEAPRADAAVQEEATLAVQEGATLAQTQAPRGLRRTGSRPVRSTRPAPDREVLEWTPAVTTPAVTILRSARAATSERTGDRAAVVAPTFDQQRRALVARGSLIPCPACTYMGTPDTSGTNRIYIRVKCRLCSTLLMPRQRVHPG